ncbi:hypothetical protein BA062_37040 [Prauserella flavalba]|uniref:Uncharacterized protein n=1 Tax=Prauserella flavalba TaxID=1477506 RepID=A0A318LCC1_9PSEU|nr:hypothetical protein BA062_37040 [Prauserella flavalba]
MLLFVSSTVATAITNLLRFRNICLSCRTEQRPLGARPTRDATERRGLPAGQGQAAIHESGV